VIGVGEYVGRTKLFVSKTPVGACKRLVALASAAFAALVPAAPCGAEIYTLIQPDGSLLITDEPPFRLPPAIPVVAVVGGEHTIDTIARRHGLDPLLVRAVIRAESNFDARAVSPKGAAGLMQLMPETAQRYGVDNRFDPAQNVDGGVRYLRDLIAMFNGDLSLALAAYNAGEGAVIKYGRRIPPYPESQLYVVRVRSFYDQLRRLDSAIPK
jgi:soluble lytic murein transglycosylase-like protein